MPRVWKLVQNIVGGGSDVKLSSVKYALEDCVKRGESRCAIEYSKMEVEPIAMLTELREANKRKTRLR